MFRAITLGVGLVGGLIVAQLPEFSQQYVQRLGGAVDALAQVVADFDASAASSDLSREEALAQLQGSEFLDRRGQDMRRTFARHERLGAQLERLESAASGVRAISVLSRPDGEVASATFEAFRPALPVTADGVMFGGAGFLASSVLVSSLGRLFRRRRTA